MCVSASVEEEDENLQEEEKEEKDCLIINGVSGWWRVHAPVP